MGMFMLETGLNKDETICHLIFFEKIFTNHTCWYINEAQTKMTSAVGNIHGSQLVYCFKS